jgi:hypothetical protein
MIPLFEHVTMTPLAKLVERHGEFRRSALADRRGRLPWVLADGCRVIEGRPCSGQGGGASKRAADFDVTWRGRAWIIRFLRAGVHLIGRSTGRMIRV